MDIIGVRLMGLTHNYNNEIADGVSEARTKGGLTEFGVKVVQEMNHLGMVVDIAHIAEAGFYEVLDVSKTPVVVSHANCRAIKDHPRNLNDNQLKALSEANGVICMSFAPMFVDEINPTLERLLDHIDHAVDIAGVQSVGLGSDFDGIDRPLAGLEDVSHLPNLTLGLAKRGYSKFDIKKILGENLLKLFQKSL